MKQTITERDFRRGLINEEHQKKVRWDKNKRDIEVKGRREVG